MKKVSLKTERRMMGAIVLIILLVLLQSCCSEYNLGIAEKKNCKCGKDLTSNAPFKKKVHNERLNSQKNGSNLDAIATDEQIPIPAVTKTATHIAESSTEEIATPSDFVSKNSGSDIKMMSDKKPPLGIKAMNTYLVAGPSLSFMSNVDDGDNKSGLGFQAGVKTNYAFSNQFNVSTGLLVKQNAVSNTIQTGGIDDPGGGDPGMEYKTKLKFTYLSAPVMAEFRTGSGFTFMAGPELNVLLGASAKTSVNGGSEQKRDTKDEMVKTGFDIQAGVKYNFPHSPLMLQLIYDHRVSRLNKESDYVVPGGSGGNNDQGPRMNSIQFGLGISFCDMLPKIFN